MKRTFLFAVALLALTGFGSVENGYADVQLRGWVGERFTRMVENHTLKTDVRYLTAPFAVKDERRERWQTEFWGKYMHSAVPYAKLELESGVGENLKAKIDAGVDAILASQEPSGYIGNYPEELRCGRGWDVWGMKYTMMGLLHYFDGELGTGNGERGKRALDACKRLCDYVIAEIGPGGRRGRELWQTGNWCGYASSSILEPVVWLYRRTGEKKYLDFASYIVKGMTEPANGPRLIDLVLRGVSVADRNGYGNVKEHGNDYVEASDRRKAYEMMSCYQGLLEYGQATGDGKFLAAAEATADQIIQDEINLAGGASSGEVWYHGARKQHLPYIHQQETCVTITWMRLLAKLAEITGKVRYVDELEKTFYNAYLASLNITCDEFAAYTPLNGSRSRGHRHCQMHTNCCNANGPRGFLTFLLSMVRARGDEIILDLFPSATVKVSLPSAGGDVTFDVYTDYPKTGVVDISCKTSGRYALSLRIPSWCESATVAVNGAKVEDKPSADGHLVLRREWKAGDTVSMNFDLRVKVHRLDHCVAFTRGPILLARDTRFGDGLLDEPIRHGMIRGDSTPVFTPVRNGRENMWMVFETKLPLGCHWTSEDGKLWSSVRFCDYASAANQWHPENACRVWFPEEYGRNE